MDVLEKLSEHGVLLSNVGLIAVSVYLAHVTRDVAKHDAEATRAIVKDDNRTLLDVVRTMVRGKRPAQTEREESHHD